MNLYTRKIVLCATVVASLSGLAPLQGQSFLTNGLVAYYPFTGSASDAGGQGLNGTVVGASLRPDRFGFAQNAYDFNGNNWIQFPDDILPATPQELSVSLWVLAGSGPYTIQQQLFDFTTRRGECGFSIIPGTPTSFSFGAHLQNSGWQTLTAPLVSNTWCHLLGIFKQGQFVQFWINGALAQSNSVPNESLFLLPDYALNTAVGIYDWAPGPYLGFSGGLDDIRIYNRALTPNEAQQLYQLESTPGPRISLLKAVKPSFTELTLGFGYQLQVSADLLTWTNHGQPFTATNSSFALPEYWEVADWSQLYFRLLVIGTP